MPKLRLDSWKSIAEYLNRGRRTVQRWHAEHGLPVHHFGGTKGCVFAYSEELDAWLSGFAEGPGHQMALRAQANEAKETRLAESTALEDELWATRTEKNLGAITELYRETLSIDPQNLHALVGFANSMILSALLEVVDSMLAYPSAMEALRRMQQADRQYIDAKCGAAFLKIAHERKWHQARIGFEQVLHENPSHTFALTGRALVHIAEAEFLDASRCVWKAWKTNPIISPPRILLSWIQFLAGDFEEAHDLVAQFKASGSSGAMMAVVQALALTQSGPISEAIVQIEEIVSEFPKNRTLHGVLGYGYAVSGQTEKADLMLKTLEGMPERKRRNCGYALALILIGLGREQEATPWLEVSYAQGSLWSLGFRSDPILKPLRGDPHFEALLRKIGSRPEAIAVDQHVPLSAAQQSAPRFVA